MITAQIIIDQNHAKRGAYGEICSYPVWCLDMENDAEKSGAWETGIESDKKGRGTSINTSLYSFDEVKKLMIIQVRRCQFGRGYNKVHKNYYLVGMNEDGSIFAHAVDFRASGLVLKSNSYGVEKALAKIWDCKIADLDDIVRNGDIAFIPVSHIPAEAKLLENGNAILRESHHVQTLNGGKLFEHESQLYVSGKAKISHAKGEHPTAKIKNGGKWRVQAGIRATTWSFSLGCGD